MTNDVGKVLDGLTGALNKMGVQRGTAQESVTTAQSSVHVVLDDGEILECVIVPGADAYWQLASLAGDVVTNGGVLCLDGDPEKWMDGTRFIIPASSITYLQVQVAEAATEAVVEAESAE